MMKKFFQKLNKDQNTEVDDLNLEYDEFYGGKTAAPAEPAQEQPRSAGGYYDVPKTAGGYEEPEYRSDNARYYEQSAEPVVTTAGGFTRDENYFKPRNTWQEEPAREPEPVFTPAPAPEYLYFTPEAYGDCREGIVNGLSTGHVVIVRLEDMEPGDILRLFDYMMGAVQALSAEMLRPRAATVVLVPDGVELDEDELEAELEDEDEDYDGEDEYEDEYEDDAAYEEDYEEDDAAYEEESDEDAE